MVENERKVDDNGYKIKLSERTNTNTSIALFSYFGVSSENPYGFLLICLHSSCDHCSVGEPFIARF